MADLVVRATLRDNVLPQLAKMAAAIDALEKKMTASHERLSEQAKRHSQRTQQEIFKIDNAMRASARRMAARAILFGAAIAAVAGHAVALTAAIWPLVGALGALPAVTTGAVAGVAALVLGFSGLLGAMKKTGGGVGSAADRIASAQRRLEMANRSLRDSQEALNDAWETARDRLRDIQTEYLGAQLDVEAAALAVRDAEIALREARSSGDRQERLRADLALRQARLAHVEAINRLSDVEQEYQDRMAQGVEGSKEVRDATERHADALYELAEAQKALDEAIRGGAGGGGEDAYAKLSASGKRLVDTLKALGPQWREVQQATQERLWAGVADHVQRLSDLYLPVMRRQLPEIAQGWNNLFASIFGVASRADRVRDIDDSLGLMAIMWQRVGISAGRFFDGFLDWTRVGADFMPRLGNWIDQHAEKWARWSREVRETGRAAQWIENSLTAGHKLNELIKSWGRSLFEIFRLGQDRTLLDRLVVGSLAFERWLKSAEGQERITRMWERAREVGSQLWRVIKEAMDILSQLDIGTAAVLFGALADALGFVADNMGFVNAVAAPLILTFTALKIATLGVRAAMALANVASGKLAGGLVGLDKQGSKLSVVLGRAGLALTGVVVASNLAGSVLGKDLNPQIDALSSSMERFARTGEMSGEAARLFGANLEDLERALEKSAQPSWWRNAWKTYEEIMGLQGIEEVPGWYGGGFHLAEQRIKSFDAALAQMVQAGNVQEAAFWFDMLRDAWQRSGRPVAELQALLPGYFAALEVGAPTQQELANSAELLAQNFEAALGNAQAFYGFLAAQANPLFAFTQAQKDYAEAQAEVNRLIEQGKEGTPEYKDAVLRLAQANLMLDDAATRAAGSLTEEMIDAMDLSAQEAAVLKEQLGLANAEVDRLDGRRAVVEIELRRARWNAVIAGQLNTPAGQQFAMATFSVLHQGGVVPGRRGEEVAAVLQAGEGVLSLKQMEALQQGRAGLGGAQKVEITFDFRGIDSEFGGVLARLLRKTVRVRAGGSVQAFIAGSGS